LTHHLSQDEIDRYVSRKAPVDEILAAAEHLDGCFDCRDRAAALVDDGTGDRPHGRVRRVIGASQALPRRHRVLLWSVIAVVVVAVAVLLIWYRP
jgi:type VI protein secretion system component VasF